MILPGKHLKPDRALLSVGGEILSVMGEGSTVSELWLQVQDLRSRRETVSPLPFDWFVLALSLLYAIGAIDQDGDRLIQAVR
jgi:hypothetical protein